MQMAKVHQKCNHLTFCEEFDKLEMLKANRETIKMGFPLIHTHTHIYKDRISMGS